MPTLEKLGRRELKALLDAVASSAPVTLFAEAGEPDSGVPFIPGKAATYYDKETPGLGVRIHAGGHAAYVFEYRPVNGGRKAAKKRLTIGAVGGVTLETAKTAAKKLHAAVRLGADPMEERQSARRAESVKELVRAYIEKHVRPLKKPSTLRSYEMQLRLYIAPRRNPKDPASPLAPGSLGGRKAIDVQRHHVRALHQEIGKEHPRTANATVALISAAYVWGAENGQLPPNHPNPAKGVERFPEDSRERFLQVDEFLRLGEALALAESTGLPWTPKSHKKLKHVPKNNRLVVFDPFAVAAIRLLIFTGARLNEILRLRWSDVDLERGIAFLPDSKTRRKPLVLTAPALEVLAGLPRLGVYVCAGETAGQKNEKPRRDLNKPWRRIVAYAGLGEKGTKGQDDYSPGLRIHDLRHSFASVGVGGRMGLPIVGKLLGHKDVKTTARYAHLETDPVRLAGDAIAGEIKARMAGNPGQVIPLQRRDS